LPGVPPDRRHDVKKIEAIIRPEKLSIVQEALRELGYPGMTVTEVKGHGTQKGIVQQYRGRQFTVEFLPKVKLELVVSDKAVDQILSAIEDNARTGAAGDGKVFVLDTVDVLRVRTGQRGEDAL
jgi:nitrogen regulatory protein P-II 1